MRFSLNIDHIATLRNARGENDPDPVAIALLAEQAGVDGIVVHLREDRRHINERDVRLLRELITTKLDLEMAATEEIIKIACDVGPELSTIVPEKRQELTTEGGVNVIDNIGKLKSAIKDLHGSEISVSLFIEPNLAIASSGLFSGRLSAAKGGPWDQSRVQETGFRSQCRTRIELQKYKNIQGSPGYRRSKHRACDNFTRGFRGNYRGRQGNDETNRLILITSIL